MLKQRGWKVLDYGYIKKNPKKTNWKFEKFKKNVTLHWKIAYHEQVTIVTSACDEHC